jgi:hypothetical protein
MSFSFRPRWPKHEATSGLCEVKKAPLTLPHWFVYKTNPSAAHDPELRITSEYACGTLRLLSGRPEGRSCTAEQHRGTLSLSPIIGNPNPNDVVVFTDSGRVSVRLTGEGYRKLATMKYCEGEDVGEGLT